MGYLEYFSDVNSFGDYALSDTKAAAKKTTLAKTTLAKTKAKSQATKPSAPTEDVGVKEDGAAAVSSADLSADSNEASPALADAALLTPETPRAASAAQKLPFELMLLEAFAIFAVVGAVFVISRLRRSIK